MKLKLTTKGTIAILALSLIGGAVIAAPAFNHNETTTNHHETTKPDWTYPACSVYADSSTPVLPPYTHKVGCVTDNGTLSLPTK
jgi:hypothetical protein